VAQHPADLKLDFSTCFVHMGQEDAQDAFHCRDCSKASFKIRNVGALGEGTVELDLSLSLIPWKITQSSPG
jgi:hypothetical protein